MFLDTFSWCTCLEAAEHLYVPLHESVGGAWVASFGWDRPSSWKVGNRENKGKKAQEKIEGWITAKMLL